jgi:NADH-quinone oxidoreductase subunit C
MTNNEIIEKVKRRFPETVQEVYEFRGDLTLVIKKEEIVRVAEFVKGDPELSFDLIIDACGVDMYRPEGRFEVVYNIYSLKNKRYLRLKVRVEENHPVVPTVTGVWPGANWHERETYDMFGVKFEGHPDLRRMYLPEEFEYHPLRKDFPVMGIPDSLPLPRR